MNLKVGGPYICQPCGYRTQDPLNWQSHCRTQKHANGGIGGKRGRPPGRTSTGPITRMGGTFEPMPNTEPQRNHRYYIAGVSGSGKSYFSAMYVRNYKLRNPDNKFYIITNKPEDAVLDALDPIHIAPENIEEIMGQPLARFANSLILFDDVDSYTPDIKKAVMQFYSHVAKDGRSDHIDSLLTMHNACNYHETRDPLINASHLVFFPQFNQGHHLLTFLKQYGDLTKAQIRDALKWDTRWVVLHREVPRYMLGEHNLQLL